MIYIDIYLFNFDVELFSIESSLVNSYPSGAAYMRQGTESAFFQIMACRLFGSKPLTEPKLTYCQHGPYEQTSVTFESRYVFFIHKRAVEIVYGMATSLSRRRWVKPVFEWGISRASPLYSRLNAHSKED